MKKKIQIQSNVLQKNDEYAGQLREIFKKGNIYTLNFVSSPGSGKTTILEKTIKKLGKEIDIYVIEGDQETSNDRERIKKAGGKAVQINTGNACHLDAKMIKIAVEELKPKQDSFLFIENVGNLICPSMFDLGEEIRIVVFSVTEGEDKPVKYPNMFHSADICIINKIDLLPYVDFDINLAKRYLSQINDKLLIFEISAKTEEGLDKWYSWILKKGRK